jgi:hypothetical protein
MAESRIAAASAKCAIEGGAGVAVQGRVIAVAPKEDPADPPDEDVTPTRRAEDLVVEQEGDKLYINFPPIHGVAPTIGGVSIYAWPRPYLTVPADLSKVINCRVSYERAAVTLPPKPDEGEGEPGTSVRVGLLMRNIRVEIVIMPWGTVPEIPDSPAVDEVPPFPGNYVHYIGVAQWIDGELSFSLGHENLFFGGISDHTVKGPSINQFMNARTWP